MTAFVALTVLALVALLWAEFTGPPARGLDREAPGLDGLPRRGVRRGRLGTNRQGRTLRHGSDGGPGAVLVGRRSAHPEKSPEPVSSGAFRLPARTRRLRAGLCERGPRCGSSGHGGPGARNHCDPGYALASALGARCSASPGARLCDRDQCNAAVRGGGSRPWRRCQHTAGSGLVLRLGSRVARDRFIAPGFANAAWGLPLYYGAQLVLALTLG